MYCPLYECKKIEFYSMSVFERIRYSNNALHRSKYVHTYRQTGKMNRKSCIGNSHKRFPNIGLCVRFNIEYVFRVWFSHIWIMLQLLPTGNEITKNPFIANKKFSSS